MCCQIVYDNLLWLLQTIGLFINILMIVSLQFCCHNLSYNNDVNREPVLKCEYMWKHFVNTFAAILSMQALAKMPEKNRRKSMKTYL